MIHLVFNRPTESMHVFQTGGSTRFVFDATGGAVQRSNGPMPVGHYILLEPEMFARSTWEIKTGWGRVRIRDMVQSDVDLLVRANRAKVLPTGSVDIGGVVAPQGRCNAYPRAVEIHGGGTALGDPGAFAAKQPLCCTLGCIRMHNQDIQTFVEFMQGLQATNTFVLSVLGAPTPCRC